MTIDENKHFKMNSRITKKQNKTKQNKELSSKVDLNDHFSFSFV